MSASSSDRDSSASSCGQASSTFSCGQASSASSCGQASSASSCGQASSAPAALAPALRAQLEGLLRAAAARAAARGMAVTAAHAVALDAPPDLAAAFARAEQLREPRFAALQPREQFELFGAGAARAVALHDAGAGALRKATESWFEQLERLPRCAPPLAAEGPFACAGIAFEPRPARERSRAWRAFASASAVLPEFALERRGGAARAHYAATLLPADAHGQAQQVERALRRFAELAAPPRPAPAAEPVDPSAAGEAAAAVPTDPLGADERRYSAALGAALAALERGEARKLVLARRQRLRWPARLCAPRTLEALRAQQPGCLSFACGIGTQTFLGATPERLVQRRGLHVHTGALAATTARGRSEAEHSALARALASSAKEREEHALVVHSIEQALAPLCAPLEPAGQPVLLETGTVQHLYTQIRAQLREPTHVLELVAALHPTAAVGGLPREAALGLIREHEGLDRGWYSGPLGWFDARGNGDFFVALRCARLTGRSAELFAGSGLLAASSAAGEAAETELKLRSAREALRS